MALTNKEVEHVALLARLKITDEEREVFARQLARILDYVEKLKELDTEGIDPTSHVLPIENVFREDAVVPSTPMEEILRNAPLRESGHYKVPKIIGDA